jgi:CheY-like chemotaxis protein
MNDLSARRLLVVDDSPTVRKLVELTFRSSEWTVGFAANGADAIRLATSHGPRLILLDVVLPDIPAVEVCDRLANDPRTENIPVVLMSAKDKAVRRSFAQYGSVVDFIQKPFTPADLDACLRSALRPRARVQTQPSLSGRWRVSEICALVAASAQSGELVFHTPHGSILVYWSRGEIALVTSFDPDDHLQELGGAWMSDNFSLESARNVQRATGKPLPVSLFDAGALPETCSLDELLRDAGRKLLSRALAAGEQTFEWRQVETLPSYVATHGRRLPVSRTQLVLGEQERTWPSVQMVFQRAPSPITDSEELVLSVRERRILALIDGRSPLQSLATTAGLDAEYVRQIAHALTSMRLIEPAGRRSDANDSCCG